MSTNPRIPRFVGMDMGAMTDGLQEINLMARQYERQIKALGQVALEIEDTLQAARETGPSAALPDTIERLLQKVYRIFPDAGDEVFHLRLLRAAAAAAEAA